MAYESSTNDPKIGLNYNPDTVKAVFGTGQQIIDTLIDKISPTEPVVNDAPKPSDRPQSPLNSSEVMRNQVFANLKNDPSFPARQKVKPDTLSKIYTLER